MHNIIFYSLDNVLKYIYLCVKLLKMNFKDHIKSLADRYGKTLNDICDNLKGGFGRETLTRNSLFVKLKNESVKISYFPELSNAIGCSIVELIVPPQGFEHKYSKKGEYLGIHKI